MKSLNFVGARQRDFAVLVNGNVYPVVIGKPLTLPDEDAVALLEAEPELWAEAEAKAPRKSPPKEA